MSDSRLLKGAAPAALAEAIGHAGATSVLVRALTAPPPSNPCPPGLVGGILRELGTRAVAGWFRWQQARDARCINATLRQLDDHVLRDLGIDRRLIPPASERPRWNLWIL
jgi:uncharacterized protein YjiS (DUF1127 family)